MQRTDFPLDGSIVKVAPKRNVLQERNGVKAWHTFLVSEGGTCNCSTMIRSLLSWQAYLVKLS